MAKSKKKGVKKTTPSIEAKPVEVKEEKPVENTNKKLVELKHISRKDDFFIMTGWGKIEFVKGIAKVKPSIKNAMSKLQNYE